MVASKATTMAEAAMPVIARNSSLEVFVLGVLDEKLNLRKTVVLKRL